MPSLHGHLDRKRAPAAIAEEAAAYTPRWYVENIDGAALAAYALSSRARLAAQPFDDVLKAPAWAEVKA